MNHWIDANFDVIGFREHNVHTPADIFFVELISEEIPFTRANPGNDGINVTSWYELRKYFLENKFTE